MDIKDLKHRLLTLNHVAGNKQIGMSLNLVRYLVAEHERRGKIEDAVQATRGEETDHIDPIDLLYFCWETVDLNPRPEEPV